MTSSAPLSLSVLDLVPVRTGQTTAQALSSARTLARRPAVLEDLAQHKHPE